MPDDDRDILQPFVDRLFRNRKRVSRLDAVLMAEALDVGPDLTAIIDLLPPGTHTRQRVADQLNSALIGHGWNQRFGTVD